MSYKWLSYKDIKPHLRGIKPLKSISSIDDIYTEVGKFVKLCQLLEKEVKKFMSKLNITNTSLSIKGIGDLIAHLGNKQIFNKTQMQQYRLAVKFRNYITHHLFMELDDGTIDIKTASRILAKANMIVNKVIDIQ